MLNAVLLERGITGGELLNTEKIEDYPGFITVGGPELAEKMTEHAKAFGADIRMETVDGIYREPDGTFRAECASGEVYRAPTVIITAGGTPTKLGVPGQIEFAGRGVSYCAVCDGAFFKGEIRRELVERLQRYMEKATREAKLHTSSINPDPAYDAAVRQFVAAVLEDHPKNRFLPEFLAFHEQILELGLYKALSQVVLKCLSPGVPDIYQGQELWDFSLVDPDNRRLVDFAHRRLLLEELRSSLTSPEAQLAMARQLARTPRDEALRRLHPPSGPHDRPLDRDRPLRLLIGYTFLGVREFPSVDPAIITVRTSYPGANSEVIESQITEPTRGGDLGRPRHPAPHLEQRRRPQQHLDRIRALGRPRDGGERRAGQGLGGDPEHPAPAGHGTDALQSLGQSAKGHI